MGSMTLRTRSNSPRFSHLVFGLKEENIQELRQFFPLNDMNTWIRKKYRSRFYAKIDLIKLKDEIYSDLINPLFIKPGINVKNLFYCFMAFYKELKRGLSQDEFESILRRFYLDFKKIAPIVNFPLSWMLESKKLIPEETTTYRLKQELEELNEKMGKIDKRRDEIMDCFLEDSFFTKEWRKKHTEIEEVKIKIDRQKKRGYILSDKLDQAMKLSEHILNWLKIARGKPGRHPKPFNVFVYHVINKCTHWKFDENHKPVYHKDGQHKLERDWKLILFLILDTHIHRKKLLELRKFISENKNKPAHKALRTLKEKLWNIYKNFPPLEGWSLPRKAYETGFRKLIVKDDERFEIVWL